MRFETPINRINALAFENSSGAFRPAADSKLCRLRNNIHTSFRSLFEVSRIVVVDVVGTSLSLHCHRRVTVALTLQRRRIIVIDEI